MDTFKLSVDAIKQADGDIRQETKARGTPIKRRYLSSDEEKSQPDYKKNIPFSELDKIIENNEKFTSMWQSTVFLPDITIEEIFTEKMNRNLCKDDEENSQLPMEFKTNETKGQNTVEESKKLRILKSQTNFEEVSTILKDEYETSIFKVPEKRPRRTKTVAKSANKPKTLKSLKYEKDKNVKFQLLLTQNNNSAKTMQNNENGLHTITKSDLDLQYLCEFQNLSSLITAEMPDRDLATALSLSRNNTGEVSRSWSDAGQVPPTHIHAGQASRSQIDVGQASRSQIDVGQASRSRSDAGDITRAQRNIREVSDIPLFVNPRQTETLNHIALDANKIESFISNRLEVLERHIHYCNCELNAIPSWSPRLKTVLHNMARRRNRDICVYLAMRYNSERRIPLFVIRQKFIEILSTIEYAMAEILDDVRHMLSNGNGRADTSIIDKATNFWIYISNYYNEFLAEFQFVSDEYPNFNIVFASMEEHFSNVKEIFFTFHECVTDLYESL